MCVTALPAVDLTEDMLKRAFDSCVAKIHPNIQAMVDHPTTWSFSKSGDYADWNEGFFEIGNWTNSFFTGMAVLAWMATEDEHFMAQLARIEPFYNAKVNVDLHAVETMHDLGFLYSLYSVAIHKATGDARQRALGIRAAEVLAGRFIPEGNYIRAWGRMDEPATDYAGLAIIDCLMNLPLLFWASDESGDLRFRDIAVRHADTTLAHFVRADDSVFHAYRFNADGSPKSGDNYCGRAVDSQWARGTTWAMYGFALAYRHTGDDRYLDVSLRVTRKFLGLLDDEVVPVWDFRLLPGEPPLRDSSAAAVAVCALQELAGFGKADDAMLVAKDRLLARLCSADYLDADPACRGLLRHGQVGDGVGKARVAYTSWGDYYFMEALGRELGLSVNWW